MSCAENGTIAVEEEIEERLVKGVLEMHRREADEVCRQNGKCENWMLSESCESSVGELLEGQHRANADSLRE